MKNPRNKNFFGMHIKFIEGMEIVDSLKIDKIKNPLDQKYYEHKMLRQEAEPIGTLMVDFLETDFDSLEAFIVFINKWGFSGLTKYSKSLATLTLTNKPVGTIKTKGLFEKAHIQSQQELKRIQQVFKEAVLYCFNLGDNEQLESVKKCTCAIDKLEEYTGYSAHFFSPEPTKGGAYILAERVVSFNIADILYTEFKEMLKTKIKIKTCGNCKKLFIVTGRSDTEFCERPRGIRADGSIIICKDVGAANKYEKNLDPIQKAYRKTYKIMHAKLKNNKYNLFEEWDKKAKKKRQEARQGKISLEEYQEWLSNSKEDI